MVIASIVIVVLMFGFLVFIHEAGHFIAAKLNGIKVEEFAFGFGPKIIAKKIKGTLYRVNLIPLGGYVLMFGDEDPSSFTQDSKYKSDPRSYLSKKVWQKMTVILAGVFINFVVAVILFQILLIWVDYKPDPIVNIVNYNFLGAEQSVGYYYNYVEEASPASRYEVPPNGFIVEVNEQNVEDRETFAQHLQDSDDQIFEITIVNLDHNVEEFSIEIGDDESIFGDTLGFYLLDVEIPMDLELVMGEYIYYAGITEDGPVEEAGFPLVGFITEIGDTPSKDISEIADVLNNYENQEIEIRVVNLQGELETYSVVLGEKEEDDKVKMGIYPAELKDFPDSFYIISYPNKILSGFFHSINISVYQVIGIGQLVANALQGDAALLFESVGTPIKVGEVIYTQASFFDNLLDPEFIKNILNLTALLSATLAFMNMLPIPIVDGGQFYLLIIEKLRGRPLSQKRQESLGKWSFIILVALSIMFVLKDVWQVFISKLFQ